MCSILTNSVLDYVVRVLLIRLASYMEKFRYLPLRVSLSWGGLFLAVFFLLSLLSGGSAFAQTDLRITGPQAGFPIAVPQLCNAGEADDQSVSISETIGRNLQLTGIFKVMNPGSFVESPGRCIEPDNIVFSDWSVIGAEGLVRGEVSVLREPQPVLQVKLYLYDVLRKQMVLGKQYRGEAKDSRRIAHKFSNEIMKYFTGESGVFGSRIAYISRVGRFKELFVMDLDGSNVRQYTRDRGLVLSPAWSPSGDRIVYTSYKTREPELYIVSSDGASQRRITQAKGMELGAEFSPDGGALVASSTYEGSSDLVLFDLRGSLIRTLTKRSGVINVSPSYSPDGGQIAFCSNRAGSPQIYVMPVDGGDGSARRISYADSNYCTSPSWSPRGDYVAFVCRSGGNQLFIASPDGNNTVQLTYAGNNEDPSWSPDGRLIAYSTTVRGPNSSIAIISLRGGSPTILGSARSSDSQPTWSPILE